LLFVVIQCAPIGFGTYGASSIKSPEDITGVLQPFVDHHTIPGAVTLVATKDEILSINAVGYADLAERRPMRADSLFWIASQSKSMTAAALMMLVDEGKVNTEDPVEKYLPEFKGQMYVAEKDQDHVLLKKPGHPIRIREILSHSSGLPFSSPIERPTLDALTLCEAVRSYAMSPLDSDPGTKYNYSNAGINTAGRIIEVVSGMPYEKFMEERLFKPLGMKDTTFWPNEEQLTRLSRCYGAKDGELVASNIGQLSYPLNDLENRHPMPAGGLFSTATDVARFCQMILNKGEFEGRRYLTEASVKAMTTKETSSAIKMDYGFGLMTGGDKASHGGAAGTHMLINQRLGLVTVYMVQQAGKWPHPEGDTILPNFISAANSLMVDRLSSKPLQLQGKTEMEDTFAYAAADINGHTPTTGADKWSAFYSPESVISTDGTRALINTAGGKPGSGGAIALYPFTAKKDMCYTLVVTFDFTRIPGVSSMGAFGFAVGSHGEKASPWMLIEAQNAKDGDSGIVGFCDDPERQAGNWASYAAFYPTITGVITLNTKTGRVEYYINNILQGTATIFPPKINYLFLKTKTPEMRSVSGISRSSPARSGRIRIFTFSLFPMKLAFLLLSLLSLPAVAAPVRSPDGYVIINKVRFFPAPGGESAMLGGKIRGSNTSYNSGYQTLAEIQSVPPANTWTEIDFPNQTPYRWIRYEGPPGSHGKIAEIEFYSGDANMTGANGGNAFGTVMATAPEHVLWQALDKKNDTWFEADQPDGAFVANDLQDRATAPAPLFDPDPAKASVFDSPVDVAIKSIPGAQIRYTLDGTWPDATHGLVYTQPIKVTGNTSIMAVAIPPGRAPSRFAWGNFFLRPDLRSDTESFHIGNSLTHVLANFPKIAGTAGRKDNFDLWVRPGAPTIEMWNVGPGKTDLACYRNAEVDGKKWDGAWKNAANVNYFTLQPRDWNTDEEAAYEEKFCDLFHQRFPNAEPWLYSECGSYNVMFGSASSKGAIPSAQVKTVLPALSWEEACSDMLLYVEDVHTKLLALDKYGKRPRILPSVLIVAWAKNLIDQGKVPGLEPGSFFDACYQDCTHPSTPTISQEGNGAYLVMLTWYAAFFRESPEGKVLPMSTTFTPAQSAIFQRLAWDIVKNYPDCGLYEKGIEPVSPPIPSPAVSALSANHVVTLTSTTPGAWFRYTLDGTTPTRTRGYIYCGVITLRPGMTLKAIAYKSGMADSPITTATYPQK
jgi:CubicO group peptidase (beta-lactamase class C family)